MIENYLKNKDIQISDNDMDMEALGTELRKGYVLEKDVQTRIDNAVKEANTQATANYTTLESNYNETVKNLNAVNEKNATLNLQMKMLKHGFKEENFNEIATLRNSLYKDEKDDEKAIASIAEKFKNTYFEREKEGSLETPPDGKFGSAGGKDKKEIKINRNTSISDLVVKKGE